MALKSRISAVQEYNRVLSQAAENVSTGYQYLPFEVYARSDFRTTVGKAYKWSSRLRKEQDRLNIIAGRGKVSDKSAIRRRVEGN